MPEIYLRNNIKTVHIQKSNDWLKLVHEIDEFNVQPMDILPVPLDQDLQPRETIKKKLWICAPHESIGDKEFSLYFSYSLPFSIDKKPLIRLLKRNVSMKILPAVSIKPCQVNPCQYDDKRSQDILIHMTNSRFDTEWKPYF